MTGAELVTLLNSFMDDEEISNAFAYQLLNMAKDTIEMRRPWMKLRRFKSDYSFASSDGYEDFKTIPDRFLMTYGDFPLKLISGTEILNFREVPMEDRDARKDELGYFYIYHNQDQLAVMGGLNKGYSGSLYYVEGTVELADAITWIFPKFAHPLLVIEALIIHRGEVDFDNINARMVNNGLGTQEKMEQVLTMWDAQLQIRSRRGKPKSDLFKGTSN